jgi:hypothetical protein
VKKILTMVKTRNQRNDKNNSEDIAHEESSEDHQTKDNSANNQLQQLIVPHGYKLVRDLDCEEESAQDSVKPKIQVFKGIGDKVSIGNWLKRFEMLSLYYKWSERKKLVMLGNYLEDDALNWFIENSDNSSFNEMKDKLINRFGV